MKKTLSGFLSIAAMISLAHAQNIEAFTQISIPDHTTVYLSQGENSYSVESKTGHAQAEVRNGTLVIRSSGPATAQVSISNLEGIDISGNGEVIGNGKFNVSELKLDISGIGKIQMDVNAQKIKSSISGKGKAELSGAAEELKADISGSGKIDALGMQVKRCRVQISGAGKVNVDVKDDLDVDISGAGSVNFIQAPARISKNISGIGKIGSADSTTSSEKSDDTTTVHIGDRRIIIIGDQSGQSGVSIQKDSLSGKATVRYHRGERVQAHWGGFELGWNNYFASGFDSRLPGGYEFLELNNGKSIAVNLNLFDWKAKILQHHLMFVTGMGIAWNNWRFQNDVSLVPNSSTLTGTFDTIDYKKSKLTASYLTLPLLLEFNSSAYEKKSFHAGAGIILGYRLASHTKLVYEENDKTRKVKTFDDFNLESFRYDATLRIGYRGYTFFASYGLNNLFKKSAAPELHPFTFGLTLLNW